VLSALEQLPLDENGRLADHWLLVPPDCADQPGGLKMPSNLAHRKIGVADGDLAGLLKLEGMCPAAVALEVGTEPGHVHGFQWGRFSGARDRFSAWVTEMSQVEMGWINFASAPDGVLHVLWVNPDDGSEVMQAELAYGEPKTHWRTVYLGHKFRVRNPATNEVVAEMEATRNEIHIVGEQGPLPEEYTKPKDRSREIASTDAYEKRRSHNVKRTFTEHGFKRVPMPTEIYGSIKAYYYNNRKNLAREDWGGKGLYVNWWEADPIMILPPFGLKSRWHKSLKPLAEEWIGGIELEETDMYGLRKYAQGAKLLKHVDRESTHAVSMIINVEQSPDLTSGSVAPWELEIHDHQTEVRACTHVQMSRPASARLGGVIGFVD